MSMKISWAIIILVVIFALVSERQWSDQCERQGGVVVANDTYHRVQNLCLKDGVPIQVK